jgi:hypothetical protein
VSVSLQPGDVFNPFGLFTGVFVPSGIAACRTLRQGDKLAYGALLRFAGRDGSCFPSMQTLGAKLGVSSRQARSYVAALEQTQLIRRVKRCNDNGQTSNGFQFLWHALLTDSVKDTSGGPRNDTSALPRNGSSAEESQIEESHLEETNTDIDSLPRNRRKRDSPSGIGSASVCKKYPLVRERLARYMQSPGEKKEYPSDRIVVDVMDAAGTHDEQEVVEALNYLHDARGLKPLTKHGPRSFAWFMTALQDHFRKKRDRESAANPCGYAEWEGRNETRLSKAQFEAMTEPIEVCG